MELLNSYTFSYQAIEILAALFWVVGFVTFAIGACLLIGRQGTLRCFETVNRLVSAFPALKSMTVPRDIRSIEQRHLRWIALIFITGAAYALYGLITGFDSWALIHAFGVNERLFSTAYWLTESVRWTLIAGNLCAIVIGFMLGIFPDTFALLEARGNSRFSVLPPVDGVDKKPFTLDNWVAEFPQAAGWIIIVAGLVPIGDFGVMLYGIR